MEVGGQVRREEVRAAGDAVGGNVGILLRAVQLATVACCFVVLFACTGNEAARPEVVVYTSVDQHHAEPVLDRFAAETGIVVKPVFDVEAAKTTGLVNRLLAERDRPQADVWWSGEFAQTVELAREGALAPYTSPSAADLPTQLMDPDGLWTGFGGRARVLLINTELLSPDAYPSSVFDLAAGDVPPDQVGMAYPLFGTTATHAAALYEQLGPDDARAYYQAIADNGTKIVDGNSVVRDQVASGQLAYGITDTDDACGALERGAPVELVFPDQGPDGMGTLVIPNTVAVVSGGPNPDTAETFVDYLLAPETTSDLIEAGWFQLPLRDVGGTAPCVDASHVAVMNVSLADAADWIDTAIVELSEVFVR